MRTREARISRVLPTPRAVRPGERVDAPRRIRRCVIDFSALPLPADVRLALADAFWSHFGARSHQQIVTLWAHVRVFARFAVQSGLPRSLADIADPLLVRYIEWLNVQRRSNGQ